AALPHFVETVGGAEAHYNVALILLNKGQKADAEQHLTLAVNKKPDFAEARKWLAEVRGETTPATHQPTDVLPASGSQPSNRVQNAGGHHTSRHSADGHKLPDAELPRVQHQTTQASPQKPLTQHPTDVQSFIVPQRRAQIVRIGQRLAETEQVGREIFRLDRGSIAHDDRTFDRVVELPNVPLPLGRHQQANRLTGRAGDAFAKQARMAGDEVVDQLRDVVETFSKRRNPNLHPVEAIEQILLK
ncbi:Tetratricopeptide repeat-containing protein, partial [Durusdinium trenchii]